MINMLDCEIGEEAKTTVQIQKNEQLPCKMIKEIRMGNNEASRAYHLREFCGGGYGKPNDTLKNVKCSEITTSQLTRIIGNVLPVSKGGVKDKKNPHDHDEGAASQRA